MKAQGILLTATLSLIFVISGFGQINPFITSWQVEENETIIIPLQSGTYNFDFTWTLTTDTSVQISGTHINADGSFETTFIEPGVYELSITGEFPHLKGYPVAKLLDVIQWGDIQWRSMDAMFATWQGSGFSATDAPDLLQVTSMNSTFDLAPNFNGAISHWDVSTITNFFRLFRGAKKFNQDISNWNVSNVTNMNATFEEADSFNQPIGIWDVGKVTTMNFLFAGNDRFNQPLRSWEVGRVKSMVNMFNNANSFDQPLNGWDVGNVNNMSGMFRGARSFNQDLDSLDVSNVTNMSEMFRDAIIFNGDISTWNVSKVTSMTNMFVNAEKFNNDIGAWDVSNVQSLRSLFNQAESFNQDISNWDVSSVTNMFLTFNGARAFNQPIGAWDVSRVTNMERMFTSATSFNHPIDSWDVRNVRNMDRMLNGANAFNQSLGNWQFHPSLRKGNETGNLLRGTRIDCQNWSTTLLGWEFNNPDLDSMFILQAFQYDTIAAIAFDSLIARGWNNAGIPVTDNCGAILPCDNDQIAPVIDELPDIIGECSASIIEVPIGVDLCQGEIIGVTDDSLSYDEQGSYPVTWVFDDGVGNVDSVVQFVIVKDTTAPIPDVETLPEVTEECSATITAPTATDNCEGAITATTDDPLTYTDQGTFTVTWTYDDGNGNISSQEQIIVVDILTPPVPDLDTLPNIIAECSETVIAPTASDVCGEKITATTNDPITYNEPGTFIITWSYDDDNTVTQLQTVIITDVTPPTITLKGEANMVVEGGAPFEDPGVNASDNCSDITIQTTGSVDVDTPGTYILTYQAIDLAGNTSDTLIRTVEVRLITQISPDDFRISFNGPNGDPNFDATLPAIAYNSIDDQYLAVWNADDTIGGMINNEIEVFGQLINADGSHDSSAFRISFMGGTGGSAFDGGRADVAHNTLKNNFLVVWRGDNSVDGQFEIWGQFVDETGQLEGSNFQISNADMSGDSSLNAIDPRITYNSSDNEFLIAWAGSKANDESEIFGKILDGDGQMVQNDFLISDQGPADSSSFGAALPAITYNSQDNEFLVAWQGDDNAGSLVDDEIEIYGQQLDSTGGSVGVAFRISDMGADGEEQFDALEPDVSYNTKDNQYIVVWRGDDGVEDDHQVYAQTLDASGNEVQEEVLISEMVGNTGNTNAESAEAPSVTYDSRQNRYLVIWDGDDLVSNGNQLEIFGQFLTTSLQEIGPDDFRISTMNDNAGARFTEVRTNDVVFNPSNGEYLAVWAGEDTGTNEEFEIYGQRIKLDLSACVDELIVTSLDLAANPHQSLFSADNTITIDGIITSDEQIILSAPNGIEFLGTQDVQFEVEVGAELIVNLESCSELLNTTLRTGNLNDR